MRTTRAAGMPTDEEAAALKIQAIKRGNSVRAQLALAKKTR